MGFAFSVGGPFAKSGLRKTLLKHFGVTAGEIATAGRQFPITARVDIQSAVEDLLRDRSGTKLLGIISPNPHEPPQLAQTWREDISDHAGRFNTRNRRGEAVGALLEERLWLSREKDLPFAILMAPGDASDCGRAYRLKLQSLPGNAGALLTACQSERSSDSSPG